MSITAVFIDTNWFLQLRDLKDLRWTELFPEAKHIEVMVAPVVISELDKHKVGSSDRRRNRARAALKTIDEASMLEDETLVLRERGPKVTLSVAPTAKTVRDHGLNPDSADDNLVAAMMEFGSDAVLLSHDTGPRISARRAKRTAFAPPDGWLLPDESSDDRKKIARLEAELKLLRNKSPELKVEFANAERGRIGLLSYRMPKLSEKRIERLSNAYLSGNARQTLTMGVSTYRQAVPNIYTQAEVDEYNRQYDKFADDVRRYFDNLHSRIERISRAPRLDFAIVNLGGVSAKDLVVELQAEGDLQMLADAGERSRTLGSFELPTAPKPVNVHMRMVGLASNSIQTSLRSIERHATRDPTSVLWIDRPGLGGRAGRYGCEDFRPGRVFVDTVFLLSPSLPCTGTFKIVASASDSPSVENAIDVTIGKSEIGWDDPVLQDILPEVVVELLVRENTD
ncbi:PIN domain-containing protein [Rhizobium sp. BK376]|uniref:PIN domain-containing protein n=1 Tax=Rhizobium sp. BK376 TaxID=2512149 RepID=UPI00105245B8|nr:PIN domain-containing protein [Rhizobium sp. BK376]TCR76749.1 PIN domain-containing protein [Rhizobium sp. BK376]